jgi:hypothetical protein
VYIRLFPLPARHLLTIVSSSSTFDRALIRKRGLAMGREFRAKGVNVALGPMMNMGRDPQGGRNWEGCVTLFRIPSGDATYRG